MGTFTKYISKELIKLNRNISEGFIKSLDIFQVDELNAAFKQTVLIVK